MARSDQDEGHRLVVGDPPAEVEIKLHSIIIEGECLPIRMEALHKKGGWAFGKFLLQSNASRRDSVTFKGFLLATDVVVCCQRISGNKKVDKSGVRPLAGIEPETCIGTDHYH